MLSKQYNPYQIQLLKQTPDEFVFYFRTDNSIEYIATFNRAEHRFKDECYQAFNVFDFSFINRQDLDKQTDGRVRDTVHRLLEYFMNENGHAIIYICDDLDNKSELRYRLFKQWFSFYESSKYQSYFNKFEFSDYEAYVGLIALNEDIGFHNYIKYLEIL